MQHNFKSRLGGGKKTDRVGCFCLKIKKMDIDVCVLVTYHIQICILFSFFNNIK